MTLQGKHAVKLHQSWALSAIAEAWTTEKKRTHKYGNSYMTRKMPGVQELKTEKKESMHTGG